MIGSLDIPSPATNEPTEDLPFLPSDRHQVFHRPGLSQLPDEADPVAHLPLRAAGQLPHRALLSARPGHLLQPGRSGLESIPFWTLILDQTFSSKFIGIYLLLDYLTILYMYEINCYNYNQGLQSIIESWPVRFNAGRHETHQVALRSQRKREQVPE